MMTIIKYMGALIAFSAIGALLIILAPLLALAYINAM